MSGVIAAALFVTSLGVPCLWKTLFSVPCLGCGLTRAALLLARGDVGGAAAMNPLIFFVAAVFASVAVRNVRRTRTGDDHGRTRGR
jgi:hypothetical protein